MSSTTIDRLDGLSSSAAIKGPCRVATTGNIALYGLQTIDGVAVVCGDRVLVKSQTAAYENGIYVVDTGQWRRSRDFDKTRDVVKGTIVHVTDGATQDGLIYEVSSANPVIIGSSAILFQVSANSAIAVSFDTKAAAQAAVINPGVHAIHLDGGSVLGDGLGGLFIDTNNGSHEQFVSAGGRTWYRSAPRDASYYTGSDSLKMSPPASYLVDGRSLPRIYPPNPPPGDYRQYHDAFFTVGTNYVDGGDGDLLNPNVIRSTAFGTFNGVQIVAWNRVDAFGHCAMMFSEYAERSAALGSDTFTWGGITSRQKAIDTAHNFYANALPNTPAWSDGSTNSPGVALEAAYPGIGQRIWDWATYHASGDAFRFNVGVGRDCGANLVYGINNTIGGYSAAGYMYAGSGNTIFGTTAMINSVFADDNVAIGYRAGRDVMDAQKSIFIGKDAGLNIKGADSSIFIGFNAGNGLAGDQDGVLVINNQFGGAPLLSGAFYDAVNRALPGVGINIAPKSIKNTSLDIRYGGQLAGLLDPNDSAAGLLISRGGDTGLTIASPTTGKGSIFFADTELNNVGGMMYDHALDRLYFRAAGVYRMQLGSGGTWVKDVMKTTAPAAGSKELWVDGSGFVKWVA